MKNLTTLQLYQIYYFVNFLISLFQRIKQQKDFLKEVNLNGKILTIEAKKCIYNMYQNMSEDIIYP